MQQPIGNSLIVVKFWVSLMIHNHESSSYSYNSAAYGASFVTKNNLSQKPIDVVSDDLASQFRDLQKNRFTKDKLPRLPDLPPPSPTNALMLPDQPQKVFYMDGSGGYCKRLD